MACFQKNKASPSIKFSYVLLLVCLQFNITALKAESDSPSLKNSPLPEPLTLEYALSLVNQSHPSIQSIKAGVYEAESEKLAADAETDTQIWFEGRLRYAEPMVDTTSELDDDHRMGILIDKTLYDFGRSGSRQEAANKTIESQHYLLLAQYQTRRIEVMRSYFGVVMADFEYTRYNEDMAVVYISLNKLREQFEAGQVSEIVLLEKEAAYQKVRRQRAQAENRQRITRSRLAYILNRPGQLPSTVSSPKNLPQLKRTLPDVELLQQQALERNNRVLALRAEIEATVKRISGVRANTNPVLKGLGEANSYSQNRSSYDRWRLELKLEVPLVTGNVNNAKVAREQARLYRLKAQLTDAEEQLRQQILEIWLKLDSLRIQQEEAQAQSDYRELYLDRSRALYEMEVKADLGDAMVRITDAERNLLKTDFEIVLAWETILMLTGNVPLTTEIETNIEVQRKASSDNIESK